MTISKGTETTVWPGDKLHFIDYNRLLLARIPTPSPFASRDSLPNDVLRGTPTSPGVVRGPVVIVSEDVLSTIAFSSGSILVCDNTDVRYLPLMKQAAGFVTNRGSLLSHASIAARELSKPCVVATKEATEVLKNGDIVEVDGSGGIISLQRSE
jgi:pyruvate,water dikinase